MQFRNTDLLIDALEILNNLHNQYENQSSHPRNLIYFMRLRIAKDIYYLLHKEQDFYEYLSNLNPNFAIIMVRFFE